MKLLFALLASMLCLYADDGSTVDVLVVYTKAAREARGGAPAMESLIREAVAQANLVFANSAISLQLRLVGTAERDYPEAGNLLTDLTRLTDPGDGVLDDIHSLRDKSGADLVSMFVSSGGAPVCGLAWINRVQGPGFAPFGFSVVVQNCAVANYGFAHEIGHNLGAAHDAENSNGPGLFPYSYGFRRASAPAFRDIMSGPCTTGCPPVPLFSNPQVRVDRAPAGAPLGEASPADNARTINAARVWVAGFRDSVVESFVSPTEVELPASGGNATLRIGLTGDWNATTAEPWIRFTSPASGNSQAQLRFTATANSSAQERSGLVRIGNEIVVVRQAGSGCDVELRDSEFFVSGFRTRDSIEVVAPASCSWVASASVPWLSIRTPTHISGSRTLIFEAGENTGKDARVGTITIGSAKATVTQVARPAACQATELTLNTLVTDQLDFASCHSVYGAIDAFAAKYTFQARAGDRVLVTASSPAFVPTVALIAPDGTRLRSQTGNGPGRRAALAAVTLPLDGRYGIEVSDAGATRVFGLVHLAVHTSGFAPASLAVFRDGTWMADLNRDQEWRAGDDLRASYGQAGDVPLVADWDGTGHKRVAVFRAGEWMVDLSGNLEFLSRDDETYRFGQAGDLPIAGDWDGTGRERAGVFRNGEWLLDGNGDFKFTPGTDVTFRFGQAGDVPVFGDWDGSGKKRLGVFRAGQWLLDIDGDGVWNESMDRAVVFGMAGDIPVIGDWDGSGKARIGVFREGQWLLDRDGDLRWDESVDISRNFGRRGDRPVPADW